jgi:hypothetical protein
MRLSMTIRYRFNSAVLLFLLIFLCTPKGINATFIQPPISTQNEPSWTGAAIKFFSGISGFYNALAKLEAEPKGQSSATFEVVLASLRSSIETYNELSTSEAPVDLDKLPPTERVAAREYFLRFGVQAPRTEGEAARFLGVQVKKLYDTLQQTSAVPSAIAALRLQSSVHETIAFALFTGVVLQGVK